MAAPLLMTESKEDYDDFVARLVEEIAPQNIYDEIKVRDAIEHTWHIRRLRWARTSIVNVSFRKAIVQLLVYELQAHEEHKAGDRKSTRLNSSHRCISYAVFCLKKKK